MLSLVDQTEPFGLLYGDAIMIMFAPNDYTKAFRMFLRTKAENDGIILEAKHGDLEENPDFQPDRCTAKIHVRKNRPELFE